MASKLLSLIALCAALSCGGSGRAPARSPTHDYPASPPQTSQGEVVGADRVSPDDKLKSGARIGTGGVTPAEGPGTSEPSRKKPPPAQSK